MTSQKITEISITPIPAIRQKILGRNSRGENMGLTRIEWLVRARTEGGLEGLSIAASARADPRQGRRLPVDPDGQRRNP